VASNGTSVTLVFSTAVSAGAGGAGGFALATPTSSLTYSSGSGTSSIVFTSATTIVQGETPTLNYTQPGNGWEDGSGNDVASCTGCVAVTNNSTQTGADSCTSGLLFSWHCEDLNVTAGSPGGCSVGDTTATAGGSGAVSSSQYKDGANACYVSTSAGTLDFTWSNDILNPNAGTIDVWIRGGGNTATEYFVYLTPDANNYVQLLSGFFYGSFKINRRAGGGTARTAEAALSPSYDTWYHVIAKWDTTIHGSNYMEICADETNGTTNCGYATDTSGTWSGSSGTLSVAQRGSGGDFYMDQLKIYDTWR
jgi:hypothetical protein